jgi:hypothetical protein
MAFLSFVLIQLQTITRKTSKDTVICSPSRSELKNGGKNKIFKTELTPHV